MAVRNFNLNPSRKRLLMLLLAGSIGCSGFSVNGQERATTLKLLPPAKLVPNNQSTEEQDGEPAQVTTPQQLLTPVQRPASEMSAPAQRPIEAQPAAGPFGQFRIARRPLFGGSKNADLKFRKPGEKLPLSPNIPKPPGMVPEVKENLAAPKRQVAQQPQTNVQPRTNVTAQPKTNRSVRSTTKPTTPAIRQQPSVTSQRPTANALRQQAVKTSPPAKSSSGGWVARQAINNSQPLRDPAQVDKRNDAPASSPPASKPIKPNPTLVPQQVPPVAKKRVAPEANVSGSRVPAVDLLPKKPSQFDRQARKLSPDRAMDAIEPQSASPGLNGPTLNEPEQTLDPTREVSPSIKRDSDSAGQEITSQPPAEVALRPGQQPVEEIQRRRPNIDIAQPSDTRERSDTRKPSGQAVSRDTDVYAENSVTSSFVGTNPWSADLDYTGRPAETVKVNGRVARMKPGIQRVLQYFYDRPEIADKRSNWGMMHSIMVYGVDTRVVAGRKSYSAIGWIAGNNICRGKRLLIEDEHGLNADSGIGLQGHQGQLLAVLSLCDVPAEYPLYAGDTKYSVADLIETEMAACKSGEELTFTLIGLAHYLDTNATWVAADGQRWDFERLIREELAQPIVGSACGGTHRLMGFAHALRKRRAEGRPISGQWARAHKFTQDFVNYTYQLQNRDGSMSTRWFEGRADDDDNDRKIQTTGHMVEWLLTITPDSQLQNPRLVAAIQYLMSTMHRDLDHDWAIGPKGHALRSLAMYYERVYNSGSGWQTRGIARSGSAQTR